MRVNRRQIVLLISNERIEPQIHQLHQMRNDHHKNIHLKHEMDTNHVLIERQQYHQQRQRGGWCGKYMKCEDDNKSNLCRRNYCFTYPVES